MCEFFRTDVDPWAWDSYQVDHLDRMEDILENCDDDQPIGQILAHAHYAKQVWAF